MTETKWQNERSHVRDMLEYLEGRISQRKWRLFLCACARRAVQKDSELSVLDAIEAAENFADDSTIDLQTYIYKLHKHIESIREENSQAFAAKAAHFTLYTKESDSFESACFCIMYAAKAFLDPQKEYAEQCDLLREIAGNPFQPIALDRKCFATSAVDIAQEIYSQRAFERTPKLASALESASCPEVSLIEHCREVDRHVRGCWAIDIIAGKK